MRAVLDAGPGAVISHTTAAAWWGLPGFDLLTIHVTRPRGLTGAPPTYASELHRVLDLQYRPGHRARRCPDRASRASDLRALRHDPPAEGRACLDTGWSKALYSGDSLRRIHQNSRVEDAAVRSSCASCSRSVDPDGSRRLPTWRRGSRRSCAARSSAPGAGKSTSATRAMIGALISLDQVAGRRRGASERYHSGLTDTAHDAVRDSDSRTPGSSSSKCGTPRSGTPSTRASPRSGRAFGGRRPATTPLTPFLHLCVAP